MRCIRGSHLRSRDVFLPSVYLEMPSVCLGIPLCRAGRGDPESKFGETFGFALFRQGLILFARFLPVFAHFLPENGQKMSKNGQIWVRLFLPKFSRIRSFSFVVRMRSSPPSDVEASLRDGLIKGV